MKNIALFIFSLTLLIGSFSCRKEWVREEDVVAPKKENTFNYKLKSDIIDLTDKLQKYFIEEDSSKLIIQNLNETKNLFTVGNKYYFLNTIEANSVVFAFKATQVIVNKDNIIIQKEELNYLNTYTLFDLTIDDPNSHMIKIRNNEKLNFSNNVNITLPSFKSTFKQDSLSLPINLESSGTITGMVFAKTILINGDRLSKYQIGVNNWNITGTASLSFDLPSYSLNKFITGTTGFILPFLGAGTGFGFIFGGKLSIGPNFKASSEFKFGAKETVLTLQFDGEPLINSNNCISTFDFLKALFNGNQEKNPPGIDGEVKTSIELVGNLGLSLEVGIGIQFIVPDISILKNNSLFYSLINAKIFMNGEASVSINHTVNIETEKASNIAKKTELTDFYKVVKVGCINYGYQVNNHSLSQINKHNFLAIFPIVGTPLVTALIQCEQGNNILDGIPLIPPRTVIKGECSTDPLEEVIFKYADVVHNQSDNEYYLFYSHYSNKKVDDQNPVRNLPDGPKSFEFIFNDINSNMGSSDFPLTKVYSTSTENIGNLYFGKVLIPDLGNWLRANPEWFRGEIDFEVNWVKLGPDKSLLKNGKLQLPSALEQDLLINPIGKVNLSPEKLHVPLYIYKSGNSNLRLDERYFGNKLTGPEAFPANSPQSKGPCMEGYHIPSNKEWRQILLYNPNFKIFDDNNELRLFNYFNSQVPGLDVRFIGHDMLRNTIHEGSKVIYWTSEYPIEFNNEPAYLGVVFSEDGSSVIQRIPKSFKGLCLCIHD